MSKLNVNAFSFVPGQIRAPQKPAQAPAQPPPAPIERPPQTEATAPPPTISLNIGGSKPPAPPAAAPNPKPAQPSATASNASVAAAPKPAVAAVTKLAASAPTSTSQASQGSTTFSLGRAKTDTIAIEREVQAAVDEATLKDLYGHGTPYISVYIFPPAYTL